MRNGILECIITLLSATEEHGNDIQVSLVEHLEGTPEGKIQAGSILVEVSSENYGDYGRIHSTPILEIKRTGITKWPREELGVSGIRQVGKLVSFFDQTLAGSDLKVTDDLNEIPKGQNMFRSLKGKA